MADRRRRSNAGFKIGVAICVAHACVRCARAAVTAADNSAFVGFLRSVTPPFTCSTWPVMKQWSDASQIAAS
ncbi:MAG TPA: hypothetical protein VF499_14735, partial [Afipia sp.]